MIYKRFQKQANLHPMNDYYPPSADSLYFEFIDKYAPYLLKHCVSENQLIEAQLYGFVELFRFNALCKLRLSSSIEAKTLVGENFSARVFESVLLLVKALQRSAQEFLGEYASIYSQINCLNDPRMCQTIAMHLGRALLVENLAETKKSVVKSFRSKDFKLSDLENGLQDDWCLAKGLPPYRGILHILAPQTETWRSQIEKLAQYPEPLFNLKITSEFSKKLDISN